MGREIELGQKVGPGGGVRCGKVCTPETGDRGSPQSQEARQSWSGLGSESVKSGMDTLSSGSLGFSFSSAEWGSKCRPPRGGERMERWECVPVLCPSWPSAQCHSWTEPESPVPSGAATRV